MLKLEERINLGTEYYVYNRARWQWFFDRIEWIVVLCLVTQLCLTLWDPTHYSPPVSSVYEDSPGKNTRLGCHALLQGILPTQGLNPGLSHCRQILYCLSHQERVLLWQVCSLGKTLLAFALLHFALQGQTCCYSRYILTSYFCIPVPYDEKNIWFWC